MNATIEICRAQPSMAWRSRAGGDEVEGKPVSRADASNLSSDKMPSRRRRVGRTMVLRAKQSSWPEVASAGPGGMHVRTATSQVVYSRPYWQIFESTTFSEDYEVEWSGQTMSPRCWACCLEVGGASDGEGLGGLARTAPIYLAPPTSCTITPIPHPSLSTPSTQHGDFINAPFFLHSPRVQRHSWHIRILVAAVMPAAQLIAMSSSARAPSSNHQVSKVSKQFHSSDNHHQTVYDDGRGRCIVESRRRSRVLRDADPREIERSHRWTMLKSIDAASSKPLSTDKTCRSSEGASSGRGQSLAMSRDSLTKISARRSETVIVFPASPRPRKANNGSTTATSIGHVELTPPPTPRMGRLPTPELPELDEAPFCDCDETSLWVYCTSCKKEAGPLVR